MACVAALPILANLYPLLRATALFRSPLRVTNHPNPTGGNDENPLNTCPCRIGDQLCCADLCSWTPWEWWWPVGVEAANVSDRRVGARLLAGLQNGFPSIRAVMADAGYESRKLARELKRRYGWRLHITKRRQCAFKVVGLTWIVERTFAWLARNRRLSEDYELKVQTSEAFIDLASIRLMLKRARPEVKLLKHPLKALG